MSSNMVPGSFPEGCQPKCYSTQCPYMSMAYPEENIKMVRHTIKQGDTLWDLANKYNTTAEEIMMANPGIDPNNLQVGQDLLIPDPPFGLGLGFGFGPWFNPFFGPWGGFRPWFWGPWI